jgi:hypothetical protein
VDITPTLPGDPESFNYLLDVAANREGADSLALPDSVRRSESQDETWHVGYGLTWKTPGGRGLVGVEYHFAKQTAEDRLFQSPVPVPVDTVSFLGLGPDRRVWDVRGGVEYACTPALKGRLGYIYRYDDRDERSNLNEYTSNTLTAGLGLLPGTSWSFDLGWSIEWIAPDFTDGTDPRESRQRLAAQMRWEF